MNGPRLDSSRSPGRSERILLFSPSRAVPSDSVELLDFFSKGAGSSRSPVVVAGGKCLVKLGREERWESNQIRSKSSPRRVWGQCQRETEASGGPSVHAAAYMPGECYYHGDGVRRDQVRALELTWKLSVV